MIFLIFLDQYTVNLMQSKKYWILDLGFCMQEFFILSLFQQFLSDNF